jgi:glycerol-3-phosphate dehydrogenase
MLLARYAAISAFATLWYEEGQKLDTRQAMGSTDMGMGELSLADRRRALAQMADEEPLDVLVVGGGITGAGVALDAAARGYRVGLVERDDYASGTSSRSTKLVHGGIRYLPELDIPLVREALIERGRLLRNAPHLVRPLSFVLPLYASSRHPVGLPIAPPGGIGLASILNLGLFVYDVLAGKENVGAHRRIRRDEVLERARCLVPDGLKTGFVYYDAQTDDTRLPLAVLRAAAARGAQIANYAEVTRFEHTSGRVSGAWVRDGLACERQGDSELLIRARHVVNATGVWAEHVERLAGDAPMLQVAPSKGVHLVFAREALDLGEEAIVLPETQDGRIIFIVPWLSRALVGTTDEGMRDGDHMAEPVAEDAEIDYLLGHLNRYIRRPLTRDDIVATYAGYRPLLRLRRGRTPARLSRTHAVVEGEDGLLTVSGGKLTTYRKMAQDVVDRIDARQGRRQQRRTHPTLHMALAGATGWAEARGELSRRGQQIGLAPDVLAHLGSAYGSEALGVLALVEARPGLVARLVSALPYIEAEVLWACSMEMAATVEDVLARRTHIAIEDRSRGLDAAARVAELMSEVLGWSEAERQRQIAAYRRFAYEQAGALASALPIEDTGEVASETVRLSEGG